MAALAQDAPAADKPTPYYTGRPVSLTTLIQSDATSIPGLGLIAREPGVRTVDFCSTVEEQQKLERGDAMVCINPRNQGIVFMDTQRVPCPENGNLLLDGAYFDVKDEDSFAHFPEVAGRGRFVLIRCHQSDGVRGTVNGWNYVVVSNHNASQTGWTAYTWEDPYVSADQMHQLVTASLGTSSNTGHGADGSVDTELCEWDLDHNVMRCALTEDGVNFAQSYSNEPK